MRTGNSSSYLEAKLFEDKVGDFLTSVCLNGTVEREKTLLSGKIRQSARCHMGDCSGG